MPQEVLQWLDPRPGQVLVDGTLGGAGHTRLLAERVVPGGLVLGLDRDPAALQAAAPRLAGLPVRLIHANFCDLPSVLAEQDLTTVDGMLLDLGLSSDQLADTSRGFSFDADGPLDLRFDVSQGEPAWRLVERLRQDDLADLIYEFGEERASRRIARRIVEARRERPIRTSAELARIVRKCFPPRRGQRIDPSTRTFQALRIAVNSELRSLEAILERAPHYLSPGGRMVVISFHSLEDRRVKTAFRDDKRYEVLTKKPIRPTEPEIAANPRARSARLRAARRAVD
ncbi:MAG: 16S rRNA (cytosine(1402)-N(4))-methyltransferase RsmH [Pirellulaceae bacterium]|nr:16S rRNA (cytosine(1402)-N(4))-methyltransferase RsmH [Pirellulaceae bacterium]